MESIANRRRRPFGLISAPDERRAVHEAMQRCALRHPGSVPRDHSFDRCCQVEPAPAGRVAAAKVSPAVVDVQPVDVRSDSQAGVAARVARRRPASGEGVRGRNPGAARWWSTSDLRSAATPLSCLVEAAAASGESQQLIADRRVDVGVALRRPCCWRRWYSRQRCSLAVTWARSCATTKVSSRRPSRSPSRPAVRSVAPVTDASSDASMRYRLGARESR